MNKIQYSRVVQKGPKDTDNCLHRTTKTKA